MQEDVIKWNKVAPPGYIWAVNVGYSNKGPLDTNIVIKMAVDTLEIPKDDVIVLRKILDYDDGSKWPYSVFVKEQWHERIENFHESGMQRAIENAELAEKLMNKVQGMIDQLESEHPEWKEANSEQAEGRLDRNKLN
jgi:hypothetical protein